MEPQNRTYDPVAVANFFIQKSNSTGIEVTPMKLLKLVYISHGWSLGLLNQPLINEAVEAWKYGPVIESLYHDLKEYGRERVTKSISKSDWRSFTPFSVTPTIPETDELTLKLLNKVWDAYGNMSGLGLSAITHEPGTPWSLTSPGGIISQDLIKAHYRELAKPKA
jgi:uncharacterized phage-associated protein